jgi:uncharacterized protein with HEPN domain
MSELRPDIAYLQDMLAYARTASRAARNWTLQDLTPMSERMAAMERWIELIGEAARKVSPEFQALHPEIAWRPIIATRHILAHNYGDVDPVILWRIATHHLPELVRQIEPLLPPPPDPEPEEL